MKKLICMMAVMAMTFGFAPTADAQGLGGLLKKGQKLLNKVSEASGALQGDVKFENGITMQNPMSDFVDVEPVGLFGVSKTQNFGDAYLVLKVKSKIPKESAAFGSSVQNQKMIAVDNNGKTYGIYSSGNKRYDTPEGIMVEVKMDDKNYMFQDIKKDVTMMQLVKVGIWFDCDHQGNITLRNVPITWLTDEK